LQINVFNIYAKIVRDVVISQFAVFLLCRLQCVVCGKIPKTAKTLPCLHNFCRSCFDVKYKSPVPEDGEGGQVRCCVDACRQPFACLPDPESGCKPLRTEEFTVDHHLFNPVQHVATINDCGREVRYPGRFVSKQPNFIMYQYCTDFQSSFTVTFSSMVNFQQLSVH